jgi:hypothetical protein
MVQDQNGHVGVMSYRRILSGMAILLLHAAGPGADRALAQEAKGIQDSLVGHWTGELEYLDYSDDETLVTLSTRLEVAVAEDGRGLDLRYFFEEPDGSIVEGTDRFYETEDGIYFGDEWKVRERAIHKDTQTLRLVLTREGSDNDRPAEIVTTVERLGSRLTITKRVQVSGEDSPFQRNQFRFELDIP